jgi:hypothetical protein
MTSRRRRSRWALRFKRRLGLEPNGLRRPADHVEASIIATLLLVFLIAAPVLGLLAGLTSYETSLRTERAQAARYPAMARLAANAPAPAPAVDDVSPPTVPVAARWTYGEVAHSGKVRVQPGAKAGTQVQVWVDGQGRPVTGQRTHLETVGHAVVMGGATVFGVAFTFWMAGLLIRRIFIHRQLAAWDEDWSAAEPRWTGRTGS